MSRWTHPICDDCWDKMYPNRPSTRVTGDTFHEICCKCGQPTDGIFIRENPDNMKCGGVHND